MANGKDSDEFLVLSKVRTGLKREFAFAMKAQSEICGGGSLGRTRGSRNNNNNGVQQHVSPTNKRAKKSKNLEKHVEVEPIVMEDVKETKEDVKVKALEDNNKNNNMEVDVMSEEEAKSDVVDLSGDDEPKKLLVSESLEKKEPLDEENKSDVVEIVSHGEPKIDAMKEEEVKEETNEEDLLKCSMTETCSMDEKVVSGNVSIPNVESNKVKAVIGCSPPRRFTRSALKLKEDDVKRLSGGNEACDGGIGFGDVVRESEDVSLVATPSHIQMLAQSRMLKSRGMKKFPSKLKDLLSTGILEGMPVKYVRGAKVWAYYIISLLYPFLSMKPSGQVEETI